MLENFTNEEIEDLLDIGYLYHKDDEIRIDPVEDAKSGRYVGKIYVHSYIMKGTGERAMPFYHSLQTLLLCEYITFDDIRTKWKYHGVLLDSPKFQEKVNGR